MEFDRATQRVRWGLAVFVATLALAGCRYESFPQGDVCEGRAYEVTEKTREYDQNGDRGNMYRLTIACGPGPDQSGYVTWDEDDDPDEWDSYSIGDIYP